MEERRLHCATEVRDALRHLSAFANDQRPLQMQKNMPTHAAVIASMKSYEQRAARYDANDMIYAYESARFYNPEPKLETDQSASSSNQLRR